jgi:linoleoyl-CoA desaturase
MRVSAFAADVSGRADSRRARPGLSGWSLPSRRRWEPWRDWTVVALVNNGMLAGIAFLHPHGVGLVLCAVPLSVGFAVGTLTVLHDAGHRMYSARAWPNVIAVQLSTPIGLWTSHWTLKHRVHHKLSQVYLLDESTRSSGLVRLHPAAPSRSVHQYQHFYAWALYGLAWAGELRSQLTYLRTGFVAATETPGPWRRAGSFATEKGLCLLVLLPYALILGFAPLAVLLLVGMTLASVLAAVLLVVGHINDGLELAEALEHRDWTRNLVLTTASFATDSTFLRWCTGGLTHHLAHHLRPVAVRSELPAVHRTTVPRVVAQTGLPMTEYVTLRAAIAGHYRRLRGLGRSVAVPQLRYKATAGGLPAGLAPRAVKPRGNTGAGTLSLALWAHARLSTAKCVRWRLFSSS